ncbi:CdaR family transcriptional regulator [Oceanobacillus polygoni]|uniref:Carbohydrate diacid regulator n=1 Tax=Oceanobacillus polygoni TaxID=1235259 RepID=A0A9X0YS39_9BACI|nr:sugar diacid recognition domain-containing protein [Oceanobacillus polygoni]MBP2077047.1 carbohydrate diacid regulator [Oceanobacillus polygoni]
MEMITKEIANAIVRETSLRLDRNVNIMDTKGTIIATKDEKRLHTVHEGAVEVLKSGRALTIYSHQDEAWGGAQPGINLPIVFQEKIIGVIGITGNPNEMGDIAELVKMATELMINQEFIASQLEWKQRTKEMIIEQLLKSSPSYDVLNRGLSMLKLELTPPFTAIVIQIDELKIPKQDFIQRLEKVFGENYVITGFISLNQIFIAVTGLEESELLTSVQSIARLLKKVQVKFRMAYSLMFHELEQLNQAYSDCKLALKISDPKKEIISFAQFEVRALLYQIDKSVGERFSTRILQRMDKTKAETLEAFFANDLNLQKTADALFLHRNTLIYRINKIANETGYDPRRFNDALILQVALWIYVQE